MQKYVIRYTVGDNPKVRKFEVIHPYRPSLLQAQQIVPLPYPGCTIKVVSVQQPH